MDESASERRRARTLTTITRCARELTAAHGLDGFTMDDLAECAGVSRRTLFNYVPSKFDAVLGTRPRTREEILERFPLDSPPNDLLHAVKELALTALQDRAPNPAEVDELRRLMRSDARLQALLHERFVETTDLITTTLAEHQGVPVDPLATRLVLTLMIVLFDAALDESLADLSTSFADHYERVFATMATLVTPPSD